MLKKKTTLQKKTGFKKGPAKPKKRLPLEQKTAAQLVEFADKAFSRYIRIRDSVLEDGQWVGVCITCPKRLVVYQDGKWLKNAQNGHLIGRGTHSLRYDEENCNLQCSHCNAWLDKDEMIERYRNAVEDKYGIGTYKKLKAISQEPDAKKLHTKPELLEIIRDSKAQLDFYLQG